MRADFRLEDWTVRPLRHCIERGDEVIRIHPKPMAVLEALAAAGGEVVTREELFEKVWPGVIVTDDALTQCIVELRKAFSDSAQEARVIKTIPKVGFCLVAPITSLDGAEKDQHLPERRSHRAIFMGTALVVVVAILLVVAGQWLKDDAEGSVSIAVLPFTDLSEAGDMQWFTDGLSDQLINQLGKVKGLRVTGSTSSFNFRGGNQDMGVIRERLEVSHVVEGSMRMEGEQMHVAARLVETSNDYILWSEDYDRPSRELIPVQQDIAEAVTDSLMENLGYRLGPVPEVAEVMKEAHEAVLMGRHLASTRTLDGVQAAIGEFEKAIEIEPDYALAHAELAISFYVLRFVGGGLTASETKTRAAFHAERALALDPNLAEAHAATAFVQDTVEARIQYFQQAIRLNPSYALAYSWTGRLLPREGRYRESFEMFETAIRLEPLSIPVVGNYAWRLIERGRIDEAEQEIEKFAPLSPPMYVRGRAWLDGLGGNYSVFALGLLEAISIGLDRKDINSVLAEYLAMLRLEREARAIPEAPLTSTLRILGKVDDTLKMRQERAARNPDSIYQRRNLGRTLAAAGNFEQARPLLEAAWLENDKQVNRSGLFRGNDATALVVACRATGREAIATEVLAAMQEYVRRLREAGITANTTQISVDYLEGITAYLSGRKDAGLSLISKAVDDGAYILPNEAYLQTLYDDPRFAPVMARQLERQTTEREKFLAVVCNDNPYAEVWQPEESTCEQFLAESESR